MIHLYCNSKLYQYSVLINKVILIKVLLIIKVVETQSILKNIRIPLIVERSCNNWAANNVFEFCATVFNSWAAIFWVLFSFTLCDHLSKWVTFCVIISFLAITPLICFPFYFLIAVCFIKWLNMIKPIFVLPSI